MARLYANENFPFPAVVELRRLGHDVLTVSETGKAGQAVPDEAVLAFATGDNRAVVTLVCTFDLDFVGQAARIHRAVLAGEPLAGQLLRINRPH